AGGAGLQRPAEATLEVGRASERRRGHLLAALAAGIGIERDARVEGHAEGGADAALGASLEVLESAQAKVAAGANAARPGQRQVARDGRQQLGRRHRGAAADAAGTERIGAQAEAGLGGQAQLDQAQAQAIAAKRSAESGAVGGARHRHAFEHAEVAIVLAGAYRLDIEGEARRHVLVAEAGLHTAVTATAGGQRGAGYAGAGNAFEQAGAGQHQATA